MDVLRHTRSPIAASPIETPLRWAPGVAWTLGLFATVGAGPWLVADRLRTGRLDDAIAQPFLLVLPLVGALLAARRPRNPVGWLLLAGGVLMTLGLLTDGGRFAGTVERVPAAALLAEVSFATTLPLLALAIVLFPDGSPPSGRWRPLAALLAGVVGLGALAALLGSWPEELYGGLENPLSPAGLGTLLGPLGRVVNGAGLLGTLLAVAALGVRFARAGAVERLQLQWVLLPLLLGVLGLVGLLTLDAVATPPAILEALVLAPFLIGVPVGAAIGVLRHRLLDIELLVNRTVVHAAVWVVLLAAYAGIVVSVGQVVQVPGTWAPPLVASVLIATAFHPLRTSVQAAVDRRLFGHRGDPFRVVTEVGRVAASPEVDQAARALAETLVAALRLPQVTVELPDGTRVTHGDTAPAAQIVRLPLHHAGEDLGHLEVTARSPSERFSRAERALLEELALQSAVALRAAGAAQQVRDSQRRLVAAVEAERQRLRRDLHDGLGAAITGLGFTVRAARNQLDDPSQAAALLDQVSADLSTTVETVRGLVYDLRPPVLGDLGLSVAVERQVRQLVEQAGLQLRLHLEPVLPPLAPALETAAFRIVTEACANVVRHAMAETCTVRIRCDGSSLEIEVSDDGRGLGGSSAGVGTTGMRQRAAEVGGTVTWETGRHAGTRVVARLPLESP